jgi:hypothetical protein
MGGRKAPALGLTGPALSNRTFSPDSQACAPGNVPTAQQVKNGKFETHTVVKTGSELAKLNIAWFGGSFDANQLYAISDAGKSATCLAKDGKTTVHYGQVIRAVIEMKDYKVDASASIAIVAASATVSGKTNTVDLYEIGYADPPLDQMLVEAKGLVSGSGINIENYSKYTDAVINAQKYAVGLPNPGIEVVACETPLTSDDVSLSLAVSWAVKEISEGRGCDDAVKAFRSQGTIYEDAIKSVYTSVAGACGVDAVGKAKAKQLLNGLKIRY